MTKLTKILINMPTNIGDTIIGLPVLDRLKANYPGAEITAIVSPQTVNFLSRTPLISKVVIFDKFWRLNTKTKFALRLRKKYGMIVDLKNSFLPVIIGARRRTPFRRRSKNIHAKDSYLSLIKKIAPRPAETKSLFNLSPGEKQKWDGAIPGHALFVACSSRSSLKRYRYDYLNTVVKELKEKYPVVILGEEADRPFYRDILSLEGVTDLVGKTSLAEIFYLLEKSAGLLLCVDSSILHIGSYLNVPLVTIFGPTPVNRYGPWSRRSLVLKQKGLACAPCQKAVCRQNYECMEIPPDKVITAAKKMIAIPQG